MRFFTIDTSKNNMIICWILIKIIYDFLSYNILNNLWYQGYGSYGINFNLFKEIISICALIGISVIYSRFSKINRFSNVLIHTLFLIYYIPINSSFSLQNLPIQYFILVNLYFVLLIILTLEKIQINNRKVIIKEKIKKTVVVQQNSIKKIQLILILICLSCIIYKLFYNGFAVPFSMLNESLYESRAIYVDSMNAISGTVSGYMVSLILNLSAYAVPIYIYFALQKRNYAFIILGLIALASLFSVIAGKGTLLFTIIVIGLYYCEKNNILKDFNRWSELILLFILIVCLTLYIFFDNYGLYFLVLRRAMFMPSWLNYLHYEYFSENYKIYLSQSTFLLQNIIPSNYSSPPITIISREYFASLIPSPNTGLFADAYINFGLCGVLIYPFIIGKIAAFSETVYGSYSRSIEILVAIKFAIDLTNVQLFRTDFVLSFFLMTTIMWLIIKIKFK